jgi:methanogenic corrinoid protein MtbC1
MVADMLEADGWDVRFLGANVPSTAVLAAIDAHDPDLLGISATMLLNASRVAELVASVRERASDRPRIVVGGAAFRMAPELAAEIGADAIAEDVVAAVTTVRELFAA